MQSSMGKQAIHKRFTPTKILQLLHVANHLLLILGLLWGQWWMWLAGFAWWYVIGTLGISIGFHRLLSHRSFRTYPWFEKLCTYLGCLATGGSPLGWVGVHRMHHQQPDKAGDPHSPLVIGAWRSYTHNWGTLQIKRRHIKDVLKMPHVRFAHRHYFKILLAWAGLLFLIDPLWGIFGYALPSVLAFHAYGQINTFCHYFGYQTHATGDSSRNNWFVNILTCGEGWHNNHHRFPNDYRIGKKFWEWDPGAWVLERCKLIRR